MRWTVVPTMPGRFILPWVVNSMFTFFFFNDTATTEIYTLSLHDALPIYPDDRSWRKLRCASSDLRPTRSPRDRKSTRLNSSHDQISYAVFCLKKKKIAPNNFPARAQLNRQALAPGHAGAPQHHTLAVHAP